MDVRGVHGGCVHVRVCMEGMCMCVHVRMCTHGGVCLEGVCM